MRHHKQLTLLSLKDPQFSIEQFHNPLLANSPLKSSQQKNSNPELSISQNQPKGSSQKKRRKKSSISHSSKHQSSNSSGKSRTKILKHSKKQQISQMLRSQDQDFEDDTFYNFNVLNIVPYPQSPQFNNILSYSFSKFNHIYQQRIQQLEQNRIKQIPYHPVDFDQSPLAFYDEAKQKFGASQYFVGMSMMARSKYLTDDALFFAKLACYTDPLSNQSWKNYINLVEDTGEFEKAAILSKTAYLLARSEDMARSCVNNNDRNFISMNMKNIRNLIAGVQNPQVFRKSLLPDVGKIQLKYPEIWKGIKILFENCCHQVLKLSVCQCILFLTRYLQNIGETDHALAILKASFNPGMTKLEIYTQYLDIKKRKQNFLAKEEIEYVCSFSHYISPELQYMFFLEIAEHLFYQQDLQYAKYVEKSYKALALDSLHVDKARRTIFFTLCRMNYHTPQITIQNDQAKFERNRYLFVYQGTMRIQDFDDWKFYLPFGLIRRHDILLELSRQYANTGRILAQWVHCLRAQRPALVMLRLWRQKIELVPKSGQLWCQGGRIFIQLGDYNQAQICFQYAMHFTPQYGDSFIEELRLLLLKGRFEKIEMLKRLYFVVEPFYGPMFSYLQISLGYGRKASLRQIWDLAMNTFKSYLYTSNKYEEENYEFKIRTFTAYKPYNHAYINMSTPEERAILYSSYDKMENK